MVAGGKGIAVIFFSFKVGVTEGVGVFEEDAERLGEFIVFLDQGLVIDFSEDGGGVFVFSGGRDEVVTGFQIEPLLVGEHLVPDVAAAAEGFFEKLGLGRVGIEAGLDGGEPDCPAVFKCLALGFLHRHDLAHPS